MAGFPELTNLESACIQHEPRRYNSCAFLCQQWAERSAMALLHSVGDSSSSRFVLELLQRFAQTRRGELRKPTLKRRGCTHVPGREKSH